MNRRLAYWLLALYPRAWRDQYGPEVASLSGELISAGETTPLRAGLNLIAGAAIERERALARSRRAVLASAAAVITAAAGIALAVRHAQPAGGAMMPYFENHSVGVLLLIVVLCWILMEFVELLQVQESREWRKGATKTGLGGWRLVAGTCAITWETAELPDLRSMAMACSCKMPQPTNGIQVSSRLSTHTWRGKITAIAIVSQEEECFHSAT